MNTYWFVNPDNGTWFATAGWDEVQKIIRDRSEINWFVFRMAPDYSSGTRVDITPVREALAAGTLVLGEGEPA